MDLQQFGEQLQTLRKQAGLSQERLVEALDQRARLDPVEEYRAVDGTLLSRWERAHTQKGRIWKPTRPYMLHLIDLFASQLDLVGAQAWAAQAGYPIRAAELQAWFPAPIAAAVPPPRHPPRRSDRLCGTGKGNPASAAAPGRPCLSSAHHHRHDAATGVMVEPVLVTTVE